MNKNLITNIVAFIIAFSGYLLGINELFIVGLFALSGAITNSLAIHMLFEKIPFLYGSGVITERFEEFKSSIYSMMMDQFFTKEHLINFFSSELEENSPKINFNELLDKTDFTPAFESLKSAVMESSFGNMLGMFGGEAALEPLREPFAKKMKSAMNKIVHTDSFQNTLHKALSSDRIADDIHKKVSEIVIKRLDELTPYMVKEIVQKMIKEHLGWLVVWGGVFGGLIGLVSSFLV